MAGFARGRNEFTSLRGEPKIFDLAQERDRRRARVLETSTADLQAEVDQIDAEWEAFHGKPVPPSAAVARQNIARRVDVVHAELRKALKEANRDDLAELHREIAIAALEVEGLQSGMAGAGGAA